MDGKIFEEIDKERPIKKPNFPLPSVFAHNKRPELLTGYATRRGPTRNKHVHFYRKQVTELGTPIYGFYITVGPEPERYETC